MRFTHFLRRPLLIGILSLMPLWTSAAPTVPPAAPEVKATTATPVAASATPIDPATEQAQSRLQQAQQRIAAAQNLLKNGANELTQLTQQLSNPPNPPNINALDIPALETLQQQLQVAEQAANSELQTRQQALDALEQPAPPAPVPAVLAVEANPSPATQKLLALQKEVDNAETQARAIEISVQPLAIQVAQAHVKLSQSLRNQARLSLEAIDARLSSLRLEAARATLRATDGSANVARDPRLKSLADENENLAQTLINLTEYLDQLNQQSSLLNSQTEAMGSDMALLQRQLQQFGFGPIMGNLLLAKRASLPSERDLADKSKDNRELLERLQLLDIKLRDEQQALLDPQARINAIIASLPKAEPGSDDSGQGNQTTLREKVSTLIDIRLSLLPKLDVLKPQILQAIANKEEALVAQRRQLDKYQNFINQNLLWLPNERSLWNQDLPSSWHALHSIFNAEAWQSLMQQQAQAIRSQPLVPMLGLSLIFVLLTLRRRLRQQLRGVIESANHNNFRVLPNSLQIIFLALLLALPVPLLLVGLGLLLNADTASSALSNSLAAALFTIAPLWLNARLFMILAQPNGMAETLFNWHPLSLKALRQAFRLYLYAATPLAFLTVYMLTFCMKAQLAAGSGQLVFILLLLLLAIIFARLTQPRGALVTHWREQHPERGFTRFAGHAFLAGHRLIHRVNRLGRRRLHLQRRDFG